MRASWISRLLVAFAFLAAFSLLTISVHAQGCYVTGSSAPNAAGNSIPTWSCEDGGDVVKRYQPPPEPDVWGAIAISTSLRFAKSWNYKSQQAAETAALSTCRSVSPIKDCKIIVSVADVCVSLAISNPERLYAVGGPIGAANYADGNAYLRCQRAGGKSCVIVESFCADGIRHITPMRDAPVIPYGRIPH